MILPNSTDYQKNLDVVKKSFEDERTMKFIEMFVGNGAMSKTEIECVLPIFTAAS